MKKKTGKKLKKRSHWDPNRKVPYRPRFAKSLCFELSCHGFKIHMPPKPKYKKPIPTLDIETAKETNVQTLLKYNTGTRTRRLTLRLLQGPTEPNVFSGRSRQNQIHQAFHPHFQHQGQALPNELRTMRLPEASPSLPICKRPSSTQTLGSGGLTRSACLATLTTRKSRSTLSSRTTTTSTATSRPFL